MYIIRMGVKMRTTIVYNAVTVYRVLQPCNCTIPVAVKVVNNILLDSQAIVGILHRSGLSLEQIARAAPRIQV